MLNHLLHVLVIHEQAFSSHLVSSSFSSLGHAAILWVSNSAFLCCSSSILLRRILLIVPHLVSVARIKGHFCLAIAELARSAHTAEELLLVDGVSSNLEAAIERIRVLKLVNVVLTHLRSIKLSETLLVLRC